jgi:taurine dioxygenase
MLKVHPTGLFNNHAKDYRHITVEPIAAAMGAEVKGVEIAKVTDAQFEEIADALYRHKMIFLRDQDMTPTDQERFTLRFGPFGKDAYTTGMPGHPDVQPVIKEAEDRVLSVFGGSWHTDSPFLPRPPSISLLYGVEIPPFGGDTMWSNMALAYATLSEPMKGVVNPLRVHMSAKEVAKTIEPPKDGKEGQGAIGSMKLTFDRKAIVDGAFHPLVRTHPVTHEKALYVDCAYAVGIEGMRDVEAEAILGFLRDHITQAAFTCRLRWTPGTFTMWDNRLTIHHAFNDHDGYRREMHRTTVLGEVPA